MDILEVWNHPELFEGFNFSELDKKIKRIQLLREQNPQFNKILEELNNRIDIDFIKDSEILEGNEVKELKNINYNHETDELDGANVLELFDISVDGFSQDNFFLGEYRTIMKLGRLYIYRKDPETGKVTVFKCRMPVHLKVLKKVLDVARQENKDIANGKAVDIKPKFIENAHKMLFKDYIEINTWQNRIPNGPPITPEGYGRFRKTILVNGRPHKYDVEVEGCGWQPTDSDNVINEMNQLINSYNSSTLHPILKAIIFKACFVKIHPFRDGNGRMSRMLLNYMLVRNGIPTVTIKGTHKEQYFLAQNAAICEQNFSLLVELVKNRLNERCNQYLQLFATLNKANNNCSETDNDCDETDLHI